MASHPFYKLGKKAARHDARTLLLARYIADVAPPPAAIDWTPAAGAYGMMANDRLGDCTIAAAGHLIQTWTGNASGSPVVLPDDDIVSAYSQIAGYNPADPATDCGAVEIDVLNAWRQNGLGAGGHKIAAFVAVNLRNPLEVQTAISLFGGIYAGALLPTNAQAQVGFVWDVLRNGDDAPGSWGGHAIPIVKYDPTGLWCVTWGKLQKMTQAWFAEYVDEAYALVTPDWIEANGRSPTGLDLATLTADLAEVSS